MFEKIDCIIGIDPGANGGITVWRRDEVRTVKMPHDLNALRDFLEWIKDVSEYPIVFLERLSVRPDDVNVSGGSANMGKLYRIQKMMQNFEQLKAVLTVEEIPFIMVHPMKWQNALKVRIKGEEKAERKRRFKDVAGRLYPAIKPTLWNADATLIMHFGRWALKNDIKWLKKNAPATMSDLFAKK